VPKKFAGGGDYGAAKVGKSRRKTSGVGQVGTIKTGSQRASGVTLGRAGNPRNVPYAEADQFGLLRNSKYRSLGPRCRENVARAIASGFVYQGQSATTEEQICFGELLRRGFTLGLGSSARSFVAQSYIAGSQVDFEVWIGGEKIALRPQNLYWHGEADKRFSDDLKGEKIMRAGYTLYDIWSSDSLTDLGIERKFDTFFGRGLG